MKKTASPAQAHSKGSVAKSPVRSVCRSSGWVIENRNAVAPYWHDTTTESIYKKTRRSVSVSTQMNGLIKPWILL